MNTLLSKEFDNLLADFSKEVKSFGQPLSFALTATPLQKSPCLIVGNNWGGNVDTPSQSTMPLTNDILDESGNPTYKGYINFFSILFDGSDAGVKDFLNKTVYTNGNLIRTPNEGVEHKNALAFGAKISHAYLRRMINLVEPKIIICFGNGEISATNSVFKSFLIEESFWKIKDKTLLPTANKGSSYKFMINTDERNYTVYSFPHASKFNMWGKELALNRNFIDLQQEIKALL